MEEIYDSEADSDVASEEAMVIYQYLTQPCYIWVHLQCWSVDRLQAL
jgi:hypothetical protein